MLIYVLWLVAEAAIIATDLAEVIGSAIALYLLFGIPIIAGVCITALDVMFILFMQNKRFEWMERLVFCLVATVTICFAVQLGFSNPNARDVMQGYIPTESIFTDQECLYVAIGIIGATVMPHNLFLHSSIVLTRKIGSDEASIQQAIRYSTWDSCVSLLVAMFVNSSILILAASVFNTNGYTDVATVMYLPLYLLLNVTVTVCINNGSSCKTRMCY
jgi:manganese transport protein